MAAIDEQAYPELWEKLRAKAEELSDPNNDPYNRGYKEGYEDCTDMYEGRSRGKY